MIRVGLTGGIGSGKTTVAKLLESYGAVVIDADSLAREALAPGTPGLARVVEEFGPGVLRSDGLLDRSRLGAVVFRDPAKRAVLNAIVHPHVGRRAAELMRAAPPDAVVVHDVPLLVENHLEGAYDLVVVVDVSPATQLARLVETRGMSEADAAAIVASQATREERGAAADAILDNEGDTSSLERQVAELWQRIVSTDQVYAGVCWRLDGDQAQVLLVLAQDGRWVFPKGHREPAEELPADTVLREVAEEAGVGGEVGHRPIATFIHERRDGSRQRVSAFLVRTVSQQEPHESWRRPTWCSRKEAVRLLSGGRSGQERDQYLRALDAALEAVATLTGRPQD